MQETTARHRASAPAWPAALRSPLLPLAAITLLAAVLRLHQIGLARTNPFYDAAVRSMGESWHNFFFGAFEPGGSVSVDKPPLDLWLQVASTKALGFNAAALILPQALAATAAVPLLYDLVRRVFGSAAGLAAAAALAVMPVAVITARSDTMDSLMMALTVLAAWLVLRAIERREARWLYAAAVVAGLNFDVKLLEALLAVPALVMLYALAASATVRERVRHIALAGVVFLVAALWWPIAVSLAPGPKPFPIGSTDGSVWNVIFVYNGLDRVHPAYSPMLPNAIAPGPTRLFQSHLSIFGRFVGIELLAALVLGALALAVLARARAPAASSLKRAFVAFIGLWLVPATLLFSAMSVLHLRYLEAISPPVAAAIGISVAALAAAASARRAAAVALALALAAVVVYATGVDPPGSPGETVGIVAAGAAVAILAIAAGRGRRARPALAAAAALALVTVLAGPTARSLLVVDAGQSDSGGPGYLPPDQLRSLAAYLGARTRGSRYEFASGFYAGAGPLVARDGRPVMVLMSVHRRPVTPVARLADAVRRGEVRFVLIGGSCGHDPLRAIGSCPAAFRWARAHSVDVSKQAGLPSRGLLFRFTERH